MLSSLVKNIRSTSLFRQLLRTGIQYTKFSIIGITASALHIFIFVCLVELVDVRELYANVLAFSAAVLVSYVGNSIWTFKHSIAGATNRHSYFIRFWLVALLGLVLNTSIVYMVVEVWGMVYQYAILLMLTLTPSAVFVLNKVWVFRHSSDSSQL